ncbi:MAG: hypothetical protein WC640_03050 [Candidatus Paceibacterota bacterium]|jgi:hypothetical protein
MTKYIIREVFTARPGQASRLAELFKKMNKEIEMGDPTKTRVLTDMVGDYNTVIMESEIDSLAEWEKEMEKYRASKNKKSPKMSAELEKEMAGYHDMFLTGHREIWQVVE